MSTIIILPFKFFKKYKKLYYIKNYKYNIIFRENDIGLQDCKEICKLFCLLPRTITNFTLELKYNF